MEERPSFLTKWDDYHMAHAHLSSLRAKHIVDRRGACLVDGRNRIFANGYNGYPYLDEEDPNKNVFGPEKTEKEISAVENCIFFKTKEIDVDCKIYMTHTPTEKDIFQIVTNNIRQVIYCKTETSPEIQELMDKLKKKERNPIKFDGIDFTFAPQRMDEKTFSITIGGGSLNSPIQNLR